MIDLKWLKSLRKGDEVIIVSVNYGHCPYSVDKVDAVTPSGNIFVGGKEFLCDGYETRTASDYGRDHIIQPTSIILREIELNQARALICKWVNEKMNFESLEKLIEIWRVINGK